MDTGTLHVIIISNKGICLTFLSQLTFALSSLANSLLVTAHKNLICFAESYNNRMLNNLR
jgi:hypothetical protein